MTQSSEVHKKLSYFGLWQNGNDFEVNRSIIFSLLLCQLWKEQRPKHTRENAHFALKSLSLHRNLLPIFKSF